MSSFCTFSFGHCVVCSSSIYGFWLPLWYLQSLLIPETCRTHLFRCLCILVIKFTFGMDYYKWVFTMNFLTNDKKGEILDFQFLHYYFTFVGHKRYMLYPLRFPHKNDVQFAFTPSCLLEGSCFLMLFVIFWVCSGVQHILTMLVTWRVSYKWHELLTFCELLCTPPVFFVEPVLLIFLVSCVVMRFVLFVFVLCLVHPMLPISLDFPFLIAPLVFSDAYLHYFQFVLLVAAYNGRPTIQHTMYLFYKILVYKTCHYFK